MAIFINISYLTLLIVAIKKIKSVQVSVPGATVPEKKFKKIVQMSGARCHGAKTSPVPEKKSENCASVGARCHHM